MAGRDGAGETNMRPGLADLARRTLSWWLDELSAMVPNALRARAAGARAEIDCVLQPDGRVAAALARGMAGALPQPEEALAPGEALQLHLRHLAESAPQGTVRLCVPREVCFLRRSRLPRRALPHAGALLRHEAEALLPFAPGDILGDWYVETENIVAGELEIVHVILARERIRAVEEACRAAGLSLVRVSVGDAEGRPVPVDLLSRQEASFLAALGRLTPLARILGGAALLLALVSPFLVIVRQDDALADLQAARAQVAKPSPAALSAAAVADFVAARASRVPLATLMDELARRLPREAVIAELRVQGDRVSLTLDGGSLESARAALLASPLLRPAPDAPPMPDGGPGQLVFDLKPLPERPALGQGEESR